METLRQLSEEYLGSIINDTEWVSARLLAEKKLQFIKSREGDLEGVRLEQRYLAQLISEVVQSSRFSVCCYQKSEMLLNMEKECACKTDTPSYSNPILAH